MMLSLAGTVHLTAKEAADLLEGYPDRTLELYDRGPTSGADAVGPEEIGRLIVIEPLSQAVAVSLMAAAPTAPWHLVPLDAHLEDADPEGDLYWQADQLYRHFDALPGVGPAITSKLLHLKRPGFYPILDTVVRDLYATAAAEACARAERCKAERPGARRLFWAAIREDLVANRETIVELRRTLTDRPTVKAKQLATLPTVRLLDMLAWSVQDGTNG